MKVIDLFCGAGGLSTGFTQAGFDVVLGVDNWPTAIRTFKENHPEAGAWCKDIADVGKLPECDIIIGSPPCPEWSIGKQGKRNYDTTLIDHFNRLVIENKPRVWIWENVPLTASLSKNCVLLDAKYYGAPQKRRRAFHSNIIIDPPRNGKILTLDDVMGWEEPKVLYNHFALNTKAHSPIYLSNRPARTAVTWPIRIYPEGVFTVDMMKKVQGFPDNYHFCGTEPEQYRQIGNAVPPPLARAIAQNILEEGIRYPKGDKSLREVFA